jgi:RimJ/RimL family protein N-acetyltransferase
VSHARVAASSYRPGVAAVRLTPFDRGHLEAVRALVADADVLRFTRVPDAPPPDFPESWLGRYEQGRSAGTSEAFAIVGGEDDFLGLAVAPKIDRLARTAELGYVVAPAARGRGVATETLRLLSEWAFAELGMLRLELLISTGNEASKRVAERCGYIREGVLRSAWIKGDRREDTELWSRLPTDR